MSDNSFADRFERGISQKMISMKMSVDHPFNRLVCDLPYAVYEVLTVPRMLARIDNENAFIGDEEPSVRRIVIIEEIQVGSDLLQHDRVGNFGRYHLLGMRRRRPGDGASNQ